MLPATKCCLYVLDGSLPVVKSNMQFCKIFLPKYGTHISKRYKMIGQKQPASISEEVVHKYVGSSHKRHKRLHVCGFSATGALGIPTLPMPENKRRQRPIYALSYPRLLVLENIDNVACGYGYSVFSSRHKNTIKVWGCGINTDSQIGFHRSRRSKKYPDIDVNKVSFKYLMEPAPIPLPLKNSGKTKVIDIACGRAHTLILTDTEGVFTFGNNAFGQCGRTVIDGELYENSRKIHNIPHHHFSSPVVKVVCGMDHSLFLTENGQVYACGWGTDGQTGLGNVATTSEPTALKGDLDGVKVKQLSSFADTTLAVSEENEVFAWGSSEYGQLTSICDSTQVSTPTNLPFTKQRKIKKVAVGATACMLLNELGEVWVWGYGMLGKGPSLESSVWPSLIPPTLFGVSVGEEDAYVRDIKCGMANFAAITNKGELYSWGKNRSGCLGIGSHRDQLFPWKVILGSQVIDVQCGVDHMIILSKCLL